MTVNKARKYVGEMFDDIAPTYDLLNHLLSLNQDKRWRKKTIELLVETNPKRILDIATGTGDVLLEIRKKSNATLYAIDISDKMLSIAKEKLLNYSDIHFFNMPAEKLDFSDEFFDVITIAFGIRNFENIDVALNEIYRALKKNGRLIILEFFKPKKNPYLHFYLKYIIPFIGMIISRNKSAYQYLFKTIDTFYTQNEFLIICKTHKFSHLKTINFNLGLVSIFVFEK